MGRLRPARALLLARAGLDGIAPRERHACASAPPSPVARSSTRRPSRSRPPRATSPTTRSASRRRSAATSARRPGAESPRGDLQAPLLALGARVRTAGAGGERTELDRATSSPGGDGRLVLEIEVDDAARAGACAALGRPHAHSYTILAVACGRDGRRRSASPWPAPARAAVRAPSVERALADGADAATAAAARPRRRRARRRRARVGLVPAADAPEPRRPGARPTSEEAAMKLTVNGVAHELESPPLASLLARPARGARHHEPEGRLPAGRLRRVHRARRRRAAPLVPDCRSPRSTAPR